MKNLLRRELAPIADEAWALIDEQAKRILNGNLSARGMVDFQGPHGWTLAALNLGGVKAGQSTVVKGVAWGLRQTLPLIEARVPFSLSLCDLDSVGRGGRTPELTAVVQAAQKAALFEERAVYFGVDEAGTTGLLSAAANKPVPCPASADRWVQAVAAAVHAIQSHGIGGPFELLLGRQPYQTVTTGNEAGYPLAKRLRDLLGGGAIRWSPAIEGGAVVSHRGGDYELTVGQDFSIGYAGLEGDRIDLFLVESFAFRVLEAAAAVELKIKS